MVKLLKVVQLLGISNIFLNTLSQLLQAEYFGSSRRCVQFRQELWLTRKMPISGKRWCLIYVHVYFKTTARYLCGPCECHLVDIWMTSNGRPSSGSVSRHKVKYTRREASLSMRKNYNKCKQIYIIMLLLNYKYLRLFGLWSSTCCLSHENLC